MQRPELSGTAADQRPLRPWTMGVLWFEECSTLSLNRQDVKAVES